MVGNERRRLDRNGRITIPPAILESLHIGPGDTVDVGLEDDRIVIRPRISREELVESIEGCIDEETRRADVEPIDPGKLKADWTGDPPN